MQSKFWRRGVGSVGVALAVGGVLAQAAPVQAGEWELIIVDKPYQARPADWPAVAKFRSGGDDAKSYEWVAPEERLRPNYSYSYPWTSLHPYTRAEAIGSRARQEAGTTGNVRALLRWKPSLNRDGSPNPNDKPPPFIALDWSLTAKGFSYTQLGSHATKDSISARSEIGSTAIPGSATVTPVIQHSKIIDTPPAYRPYFSVPDGRPMGEWKAQTMKRTFALLFVKNLPLSQEPLAPRGARDFWLGPVIIKAGGFAGGGRIDVVKSGTGQTETPMPGGANASLTFEGSKIDTTFTPNPEGLALMERAFPDKPLNQYVIGGHPFAIPCSVSFSGSDWNPDPELRNKLKSGFSWRLTNPPASLPALPGLGNTFVLPYSLQIAPQFRDPFAPTPSPSPTGSPSPTPNPSPTGSPSPSPTGSPAPTAMPTPSLGLGFDARVLPLSNDAFGTGGTTPRTVEHLFEGNAIAKAPWRCSTTPPGPHIQRAGRCT